MNRYRTSAQAVTALANRPGDQVTFRGHMSAGLLIRAQVRNALRALELEPGVDVTWVETKSLLGSYYTYRVVGVSRNVRAALLTMFELLPEIEEG